MTTEQYQEIIGHFGVINQRFDGVDQEIKALETKIDDIKEDILSFASDIHDGLSSRINAIEVFVDMPKTPTNSTIGED